jgi:hypothetical protein
MPEFDPRGLIAPLERHHVAYVIVGAFGRVVQGADEVTLGIDIVPSTREDNLRRLEAALSEVGARLPNGTEPTLTGGEQLEPVLELTTDRGQLKIIPEPKGTRGYDDLRRAAMEAHIGQGLSPAVASRGDLSRMLSALGREEDLPKLLDLRRLAELEISQGIEI